MTKPETHSFLGDSYDKVSKLYFPLSCQDCDSKIKKPISMFSTNFQIWGSFESRHLDLHLVWTDLIHGFKFEI